MGSCRMERMDGNRECPETIWTEHNSQGRIQMYQKVGKTTPPPPKRNYVSFFNLRAEHTPFDSVLG